MVLPKGSASADFQLASILSQHPELIQPRSERPIARIFCSNAWGQSLDSVDCRGGVISGRAVTSSLDWKTQAFANPELVLALQERQSRLEKLRSLVQTAATDKHSLSTLHNLLEKRLASVSLIFDTSGSPFPQPYATVFVNLLVLDGHRYDVSSGKFIPLRYDIFRALEEESNFIGRSERTRVALAVTPYFIFLFCLVWLAIGLQARNMRSQVLVFGMVGLSVFGLLLCADAAVRFGAQSLAYSLNPLGATLPNQLLWLAIMSLISIVFIKTFSYVETGGKGRIPQALLKGLRFYKDIKFEHLAVLGALLIAGAYQLFSPAVGAETLKLIACLLSGVLLSQHGREVFLVRKYLPNSFSLSLFWESLSSLNHESSTSKRIHRLFLRSYFLFFIFGLFTVGMTAFGFGDLGGTAVAVCIVLSLTLLLYGWPLFVLAIALGAIAVSLALKMSKVQDRLALMLEPSRAAVSDFARLIAFEESPQPYGQGVGTLRWCNELGVCVPVQILSDYIPIVISASAGRLVSVLVFLLIFLGSLFFAYRALTCFSATNSRSRVVLATAFFLFVSTSVQTVITFFGNWRLLPLTGLGVPFVSIGISSIAAGYLAVAITLSYELSGRARRL